MGGITATESAGLRFAASGEGHGAGLELGVSFRLKPSPEDARCPAGARYYSSPGHPDKEYRACPSYTYWAFSLFTGVTRELDSPAPEFDFPASVGASLHWTWAESLFLSKHRLDGSDAKIYHPADVSLGPVFQSSWSRGLAHIEGGLEAGVTIHDRFYLKGAVLFGRDADVSSGYFALGVNL